MSLTLDRVEIEGVGSDPVGLADALLRQLPDLDGRVPIDEIARALDIIDILEAPLAGLEGCLQTDGQKSEGQIIVRAGRSARRRRFTIAHELGHFLNERHRPVPGVGFACTAQDMRSPVGEGVRLRQETEANTFAIEALTPRRLLARSLRLSADLERALQIADRFDVSREAALRRYVALHAERLAAVFSAEGRVRYVVKGPEFPATSVWNGDPVGHLLLGGGSKDLTSMEEAPPDDWIRGRFRGAVFAQTLYQEHGHAMTLLIAEAPEHEDDAGVAELGEPTFGPRRRR